MTDILLKIAAVVALLAVGFSTGWTVNGWRMGTEVQSLKAQHEKTVSDASEIANQRLIALTKEHDAKAERLANIDLDATQKLTKVQNENKILAARLAAGSVGLRISATCDAATGRSTEAAQGASLGSGTSATLDSAAGQAYSALRQGITDTEGKLTACQRMLSEFSP